MYNYKSQSKMSILCLLSFLEIMYCFYKYVHASTLDIKIIPIEAVRV